MDDVIYTVSSVKIKANDLNNVEKEVKVIELPFEKEAQQSVVIYE